MKKFDSIRRVEVECVTKLNTSEGDFWIVQDVEDGTYHVANEFDLLKLNEGDQE